jgi:hypothetical protein
LEIDFISKEEPSSVLLSSGEVMDERIEDDWEMNWYTIDWYEDGKWSWSLESDQLDTKWEWVLYDQQQQVVDRWSGNLKSNQSYVWDIPLKKGRYFLRLQGKTNGNPSGYRIKFIKKN